MQEDFQRATGKLKISLCRSFIILFSFSFWFFSFFFPLWDNQGLYSTHNGAAGQQQLTLLPNANAVIMSSKPIGLDVPDLGWSWAPKSKSKSEDASDICIIKIDVHAASEERSCVLASSIERAVRLVHCLFIIPATSALIELPKLRSA